MVKDIKITRTNGKVQHLSDILPMIETNTILNKTITGIGATYSELKAQRNSIIIEPNKPVIFGKCKDKKHKEDNLFGVFQGVYKDDVIDYLERSHSQKKLVKILTTPESFKKVLDAFEELDIDIRYDGYFLLFDECQKIVKDCDYRQDITLPMDLFFECKDKAMVSATPPTELSDPRFKEFNVAKIVPDFDFKTELNLHTTNNVLQCTRELLKSLGTDERPVFLFANSTDMIYALMKQLGVIEQSAVFCSEKSAEKLRQKSFSATSDLWDIKKMAHYNWMTSRFYSALDIELSVEPNIIMLTECFVADYTMIDPYMDAVQIIGRFRNGVNKVFHISNYDKRIPIKSKEEIIYSVRDAEIVYKYLGTLADSAPTKSMREEFQKAQGTVPYNIFLGEDGKVSPYKVDNYIDEEVLKVIYNKGDNLQTAYDKCGYFNVVHSNKYYTMGDYERLKIENKTASIREKRKEIVLQLEMLGECDTEVKCQHKRDLAFADSLIVEAYDLLGKEEIEKLKYSVTKIKKEILIKRHEQKACCCDTIQLVLAAFHSCKWYSANEIKKNLQNIYETMGVPKIREITSHAIKLYFEAVEERRNTKRDKGRGYYLIKPRFVTF